MRLERLKHDDEDLIKKRINRYFSALTMLEEAFKDCMLTVDSSMLIDQVADKIADSINNPIF